MQLNLDADGPARLEVDTPAGPTILRRRVATPGANQSLMGRVVRRCHRLAAPGNKQSLMRRVVLALRRSYRDEVQLFGGTERALVSDGGRQAVVEAPLGNADGGKVWWRENPYPLAPFSPEELAATMLKYIQSSPSQTTRLGSPHVGVDLGRTEGLTNPERIELLRLRRENRILRRKLEIATNVAARFIVASGATPERRPRSSNANPVGRRDAR